MLKQKKYDEQDDKLKSNTANRKLQLNTPHSLQMHRKVQELVNIVYHSSLKQQCINCHNCFRKEY